LTDPGDEFVLELAVAAECRSVVTHNVRDFTQAHMFNIQVLTPAEFLRALREDR
jgi:predicted nucleic acid-binding protein